MKNGDKKVQATFELDETLVKELREKFTVKRNHLKS